MNTLRVKEIVLALFFIFSVSIICHSLFSSLGFIPMDDGFFLAYSRRMLDGQIPYKDFLYYANIGSPLLYVPFVRFGGDYTFWITRYVFWFQFACISWIWTYIITKNFLSHKVSSLFRFVIASFAFIFNTHSFPLMVWYTVDGLFFYSLGLLLCLKENKNLKTIGYVLVGCTLLIKQNFIFLLPVTIFLLKDWKSIRHWFALLFPSLVFYAYFLFFGALGDLITQTTSRTEFFDSAIKAYTGKFALPWGIIIGYSGVVLLYATKLYKKFFGIGFLFSPLLYTVVYFHRPEKYFYDSSFLLLGSIIGLALFFINREKLSKNTVILLLGAITAWCLGISGGYITPALGGGIMVIYLSTIINYFVTTHNKLKKILKPVWIITLVLLIPLVIKNYYYIRTHNIYGGQHNANELTYKADSVLPGGKNILISKDVYDTLLDLHGAIKIAKSKHKPYTILSYGTSLWVKSPDINPLPIDYYFIYATQKPLVEPLRQAIINGKGKIIVIVHRDFLKEKEDYSQYNSVYRFALLAPKYYIQFDKTKYHVLFE